jgi:hypothetical protein
MGISLDPSPQAAQCRIRILFFGLVSILYSDFALGIRNTPKIDQKENLLQEHLGFEITTA